MKRNILIIISFFSLLVSNSINNYNSIYYLSKNPKTNSLSGIHTLSNNISGLFYQPLSRENIKGDTFFSYVNQFDNSINIVQFGYCLLHDKEKNISIGFINRKINDIYDTSQAWNPLNDLDEPNFNEIDYNNIKDLSYKNFGFTVSYNKFLRNNIISVKIKPHYESIQSVNAIGIDLDFMLYKKINNVHFIGGVNDLISYKKWNSGIIENNKLNYFVSTSVNASNIGLFIEANSLYNERIGFEYNYKSILAIRFATNIEEDFSYGVGLDLKTIEFSYVYIPINDKLGSIDQMSLSFKISGLKKFKEKLKP